MYNSFEDLTREMKNSEETHVNHWVQSMKMSQKSYTEPELVFLLLVLKIKNLDFTKRIQDLHTQRLKDNIFTLLCPEFCHPFLSSSTLIQCSVAHEEDRADPYSSSVLFPPGQSSVYSPIGNQMLYLYPIKSL